MSPPTHKATPREPPKSVELSVRVLHSGSKCQKKTPKNKFLSSHFAQSFQIYWWGSWIRVFLFVVFKSFWFFFHSEKSSKLEAMNIKTKANVKWPPKNEFPKSDFMSFSMQVSANSHFLWLITLYLQKIVKLIRLFLRIFWNPIFGGILKLGPTVCY